MNSSNEKLGSEIRSFVDSRHSLMLSTLTPQGEPYASYAPFAYADDNLYVLISEIATHALNLQVNSSASVLIIEDEDSANELFARRRVNYRIQSEPIPVDSERWQPAIDLLRDRLGSRIDGLSRLSDFKLFKLTPLSGRYVKGFGRAYAFEGSGFTGNEVNHLQDGHKRRDTVEESRPDTVSG